MTRASLDALCIMLAMQMRPLSNWSATFKNLQAGRELAGLLHWGGQGEWLKRGLVVAAWL